MAGAGAMRGDGGMAPAGGIAPASGTTPDGKTMGAGIPLMGSGGRSSGAPKYNWRLTAACKGEQDKV